MDLKETGWKVVDWMYLAQGKDEWHALVNMIMNLWVPWKEGNFLASQVIIRFSRRTLLHEVS
jgi:hypothetical protein